MKKHFDNYQRLARSFFLCSSFWLGPRDLLYVKGHGVLLPFSEEYHRFEFSRIVAITCSKTYTGFVLRLIYSGVALVSGGMGAAGVAMAWSRNFSSGGAMISLIFAVPCLAIAAVAGALLIIEMVCGPTCVFKIQTASRFEGIRAVCRLPVARRVMQQLQPILSSSPSLTSSVAATTKERPSEVSIFSEAAEPALVGRDPVAEQ